MFTPLAAGIGGTERMKTIERLKTMDWQQVVLNGGPPCFNVCPEDMGGFCGRAQRWEGHPSDHKFISIDELVANELEALTKERDELRVAVVDHHYSGCPDCNEVISRIDDSWLDGIAKLWNERHPGKVYGVKDGETREEGLMANLACVFDDLDNLQFQLTEANAHRAECNRLIGFLACTVRCGEKLVHADEVWINRVIEGNGPNPLLLELEACRSDKKVMDWLESHKVSINELHVSRDSTDKYWHLWFGEPCRHFGGEATAGLTLRQSILAAIKEAGE